MISSWPLPHLQIRHLLHELPVGSIGHSLGPLWQAFYLLKLTKGLKPNQNNLHDSWNSQSEISTIPSMSISNCDSSNQQLLYDINKSNQLLLESIIKDGAPLSLVEGKKFKEFIYSINNLYHVLSKRKLLNNILDEVYMNIQTSINKFLYKSSWIIIATDSWTNICQNHLVNFIIIGKDQ
ncbi:10874_t:CDS:2 [Cetraspora pellucida]|uniref:10874_t:CDS:1 n=1 Tax=Cetraspora pellucida TaxID=1433469 RepID=A0A9N9IHJ8_9GLOM|nr:10874_t:CDS:2 [Cetraspora pellucida]